jgi:hypothetical protein
MCGPSHCAGFKPIQPEFKQFQISFKPFNLGSFQKGPSLAQKIQIKYDFEELKR